MYISFVIITWNSSEHINRCLQSVFEHYTDDSPEIEIFVVDNGSSDDTVKIIKDWQHRCPTIVKLIGLERNFGTTYSRNVALRQATGDFIVIIDSDVEFPLAVVQALVSKLDNESSIGLVVPRLYYPSGRLQKSTDIFPTIFTKLFRFFFLKFQESYDERFNNNGHVKEVDYAISAFWVFRRELIEIVGLLDENIFYAPEDVDYCLRIWKHGYTVVLDPSVQAIHHAQELSRGIRINSAQLEHIKGLWYFFRKHKYFFKRPRF